MTRGEQIVRDLSRLFAPPRHISVSEWADRYLYLSPEYAAKPGKFTCYPFQRGPMDSFSSPDTWQVVIKGATQILKTLVNQAVIAWIIDTDPGPVLVVNERESDADAFGKERIGPMTRDTPRLQGKLSDSGSRRSKNTLREKWFPGGMLAITFASAPGNLARRSIRYLICEEEDKWPASSGGRGNPFAMALSRTDTYRGRKKVIRSSSPSKVNSAIDRAYQDSDQRELFVPCPHCGAMQSMMEKFFTQVRWDETLLTREEQAASARYYCEDCDQPWDDVQRTEAVDRGQWIAQAPFNGIAGYWISKLYSPWKTLPEIVMDFLAKKDNPIEYMTFVNETLAENWVEPGETVEWEGLLKRCEEYPVGIVPRGGLFLTGGGDVQHDRIEAEMVAWGRRRESWSIDYRVFEGDTSRPEVWERFWTFVHSTWPTQGGAVMPCSRFFLDSGDQSHVVYDQVRRQPSNRVVAIKGAHKGLLPVSQPSAVDVTIAGRKIKHGLRIRHVLSGFFKGELYADLKKSIEEEIPNGYCHFPKGQYYGEEHFRQLCSEQLVTWQDRSGRVHRDWKQKRPRNEALDCRVYARAAAYDLGMDRFAEHHWAQLEALLQGELFSPEPTAAADSARVELPPAPHPAAPPLPTVPAMLVAPRRRMQVRLC